VPLFVRVPGRAASRIDAPVGLVDVAATIYELLQVEGPTTSGRSLVPLLAGGAEDAPRAVVSGFMEHHRSIVLGHWKLIHRTRGRYALFDLASDPSETRDVAAEHPLVVELLRGVLGLELARAGDPAPGARGRPRRRHREERTTIDSETEAQLRAIGYAN
jgi:arylsulfatase A-like enzyme